jgi:hypothetical protein
VKAGDRILFGKWSGTEVKLDGEELLIMKESDIMGIIEGQPASASHANRMEPAGFRVPSRVVLELPMTHPAW